jgi:hypothetical protein
MMTMGAGIKPFERFMERATEPQQSLVLVNRTEPDAIRGMLEDLLTDQSVTVADLDLPGEEEDVVALLEDGDVVASSPLSRLEETILFVNSDIYTTGTTGIEELSVPDVILHLDEVPFRLRGYPESLKEKFLLITISRHIEQMAWHSEGGVLRSSFQRLSRIEDEAGTRAVYERLSSANPSVHLYGQPDWSPEPESELIIHGGYHPAFRRTWFVVFQPAESGGRHGALVAIEYEKRQWRGFWTYRPELITEINRHIERTL